MTYSSESIGLFQIIIPAICTGILIVGNIQYLYIALKRRDKIHVSLSMAGFLSLGFVGSHLLNLIVGGIAGNPDAGRQIHRIEQVAVTFYLFVFPYFVSNLLILTKRWQKVNRVITMSGLIVSFIITVIAFAAPDLFVSISSHSLSWLSRTTNYGRGQEGMVYIIRDGIFGVLIAYGLICFIVELIMHGRYQHIMLPLIGYVLAMLGAFDDVVFIYTGTFTVLPSLLFTRFALGITMFILISMFGLTKMYIDQANQAERSYGELKNAYRVLHRSEERFRQFANCIQDIFMLIDYQNNVMLYISPAYEIITGMKIGNIYERPDTWLEYIHPDDRKAITEAFKPQNIKERFEVLYRFVRPDGETRWLRQQTVPARDRNNMIYRLACVVEDITERKKSEDQLSYIAYHDALTGLPNRRSFFERLQSLLLHDPRDKSKKNKAVFIIDIDRFKNINDTYGHACGDALIREAGSRLKSGLRESDYVCRIGGDKFSVLLNGITEEIDAALVARKINDALSTPYTIEGRKILITLRQGISIYPKDGYDTETLIKSAELALEVAREKNTLYTYYSDELNARAQERISIEKNLRYALEGEQLSLHYQPMVNMDGKIMGMEALLRWHHPEMGHIPPDKFIPIAESTGMIVEIGNWTIRTACRQRKSWEEMGFGDIKMSVNMSTKQLMDDDLIATIRSCLDENGLDSRKLDLEITESCIMENPELAVSKINDLFDIGISLSIDDFGTGYSSLSYLKRFKIENLKVDKSFIVDVKVDVNNAEITKAIIAMAHSLSLKVIAEGVETKEQLDFLKQHNCDMLQGFLFSRPLPADEITTMLKRGLYIVLG